MTENTRENGDDEAQAGGGDGTVDSAPSEGQAETQPSGEQGQSEAPRREGTSVDSQQQGGGQQPPQGRQQRGSGQQPPQGRQQRGSGHQSTAGGQPAGNYQPSTGTSLDSNVAAALSYALIWLSGLAFLVIEEEDDFVRFHAAQSIVVFGGLTVGYFVFSMVFVSLLFSSGAFGLFQLMRLLWLGVVVLWLGLMYMAYDGRWFRVPVAADIADNIISDQGPSGQPRQPRGQHVAGHQQAAGNQSATDQPASRGQQSGQRTQAGEHDQQRPTQNQ
ncbi:DUF4870 domain-containing protein [Halorhabdus rudnickae]|uniref:DUF4870 domain-containing protein n=1 Tax=Halorhabdus rudnickae TaxID=1775544 RepID=UPI001AEFBFFB|nr:hypothetical protein [Halorhabdus rudnickae]